MGQEVGQSCGGLEVGRGLVDWGSGGDGGLEVRPPDLQSSAALPDLQSTTAKLTGQCWWWTGGRTGLVGWRSGGAGGLEVEWIWWTGGRVDLRSGEAGGLEVRRWECGLEKGRSWWTGGQGVLVDWR